MNAKTPASLRAFICLLCSLGFCLQNASAQLSRPTEAKKDVDISVLDIPINDEPVNDLPSSDFPVKDVPVNIEPIRADVGLIEMVPDDPSMGSVDRMLIGPGMPGGPENLTPADIIASVYRSFPEINQARQQARLAQGEQIEAAGAYDVKFKAYTLSEPTGFYENYRNGLAFARQTWWGGQVAAGYRIGRGQFQPWYRERETEKGGEFKVGWIQPLLQGRAIDEQRVAVFRASLSRQMADPILQEAILNTSRDAMFAYWQWVAWGAVLEAQRELLEIAETRGSQFEVGVAAGKFAEIDLIVNQQVIAERRAKVLETERKYRETAIKLSLYLRNELGNPMLPPDQWLPKTFPAIEALPPNGLDAAISLAIELRPEPRRLQFEICQIDLDRRLARNQILPRLDFIVEGSQDVGDPASKSNDKGPFELVIGATK